MNAIDILTKCRDAGGEIRRLEECITRYRNCATDTSARIAPAGRVQGSSSDAVSTFAVEIKDCEQRLAQRQDEYAAESYCACRLLDTLPEIECAVLYRYFLSAQTIGAIASALKYSAGYVKRKKADGIALIEQTDAETLRALLPDWYLEGERNPESASARRS